MKIKTKIYIATAVISILFSGMYFVLLNQLHGLDGKITKAMYANRVRELVVEARRAEENYLRTGNSERIKDFTFSMDEILDSAEKTAPGRAFAVSPDMELITGLARDYRRAFDDIVQIRRKMDPARDNLAEKGRLLEAAIREALETLSKKETGAVLSETVGNIALGNKILKEGYGGELNPLTPERSMSRIQAAIRQFIHRLDHDNLSEAATAYARSFKAVGELEEQSAGLADRLHEIAHALEIRSVEVLQAMNQKRNQAKDALMLAVLTLFAGCGILILSMSFFFGSILAGPVRRLRKAMLRVGSGDLEARIDVQSRDEIGELAESFRVMVAKLRDSYEKLNRANEHLKKLDELKSKFMSAASHELKTPLTSLKGYLEMVLNGEAGFINDEQKEYLGYVKESTDRLYRLVKELLNISKIESGQAKMERTLTDLRELVRKEALLFIPQAQEKNTEISDDIAPDLNPVYCDPDKIREVLDNLISNAVKYTPVCGKIRVFSRNHADGVEIGVEDNGIGIRPEDQQRIFEPFQRIENGTEGDGEESTGLGLTLVKKIVEAHGGRIGVRSEAGRGTSFTIILPFDMKQAKLNDLIGA